MAVANWVDGQTYSKDDVVIHSNKIWKSTVNNNTSEPGVSNWNAVYTMWRYHNSSGWVKDANPYIYKNGVWEVTVPKIYKNGVWVDML